MRWFVYRPKGADFHVNVSDMAMADERTSGMRSKWV